MTNTALNRTTIQQLRNKSGSTRLQGTVVIVDTGTEKSFNTTTTANYTSTQIGVVIEPAGILNDEIGSVALLGWVPKINLTSSAALGDYVSTSTTEGQGKVASVTEQGTFAEVLETGATPEAFLFGNSSGASSYIADTQYKSYTASTGDKTVFEETIPAMPSGTIKSLSWGTLLNNDSVNRNIQVKLLLDAETINGPTISADDAVSYDWTLETILTHSAGGGGGFPYVVYLKFVMQIDDASAPTTAFIANYYDFFSADENDPHTYKAVINLSDADIDMEVYSTIIEGPYFS